MGSIHSINPAANPDDKTVKSADPLLKNVLDLASGDMNGVNRHIKSQLVSDVALIQEVGRYIIAAGGKRLRPVTVVLSAHALGYQGT
ncbi:MAG: hypothetical protein GY922_03110, partial [Proteobacteria bacterium]|nr:hypothetical protein [Pseudomonadota bacterium]